MGYRVVILPTAAAQVSDLPKSVRQKVHRRLQWPEENAAVVIHHPLTGLPPYLSGLCKLRSGDYRILYWKYPEKELIEVFSVRHRSEVYRKL